MSRIIVNGAGDPLPPGDPVPPRLNIANLIKDEKQWSLYVQALILLQQEDYQEPLSYFSIAAIHGWPLDLLWQDGGQKNEIGYCAHGVQTFPTWHRPYVALFEQSLQAAAVEVAKQYKTDVDAWGQAAANLRSPYWDWADPHTYLPPPQVYDYVNYENVRVVTPAGPKDLPNPLLAYTFQREIQWDYPQPTTVRHPGTRDPIAQFKQEVGTTANRTDLQGTFWKTLNWINTWDEFSNAAAISGGQRANSLETIHGWIHNRSGGNGHMGDPIAAGYDPIFMLHHTNVDRQLALWQALHPDVWIDGTLSEEDLRPFWKTNDQFYNSTDEPVKNFTQFRATYPEFVGLEELSPAQRKAAIQKTVDALYKPRGRPGLRVLSSSNDAARLAAPPSEARLAAPDEGERSAPSDDDEVRLDWLARVRVKKFQFKQSFNVIVFLGEVPEHVEQYLSSPSYVGTHSEFVNSAPEHCRSCSEHADIITEGVVNLNNALERNGYEHKSEEEIKQYIKENIYWRVQKIDGSLVPISEVDILEVAVATWDVTSGDVHAPLVYHDITSDRDGGYKPGNQPYHL